MSVIIRGLSGLSKKIKDATITPDKVLRNEVGYGNDNERIVGTHVCKKYSQVMKVAKGERLSNANSSRETMQKFNMCAHFNRGDYESIETVFMSAKNRFDEVAILKLGKSNNSHNESVTVIRKQSANVKLGRNVNLFIVVDGMRLNIFLADPVDESYNYIDPASFSSKNFFELKIDSEYLSFVYEGSIIATSMLSFYLRIDQGIITEFGLTAENSVWNTIYAINNIEFGIEWI